VSPIENAPIESLLAHRGWVRKLALRLARDESAADDLAQDVWVAALRDPPRRSGGSVRAWLGRVLRNRAREVHRGRSRRETREAAIARPDRAESTDGIVSRADTHRHVVTAVLTLDEPYRTTVLLLFFEGLRTSEVADRMGVPVETVRTRARRALATLRARLDRDHGGDRRTWAVALLGVEMCDRIGGSVAAGVRVSTVGDLVKTGVTMAKWKTIGAAAAGGVAGVVLTLLAQGPAPVLDPPPVAIVEVEVAEITAEEVPPRVVVPVSVDPPPPAVEAPPADPVPEPEPVAADPAPVPIEITVPAKAAEAIRGRVLFADGSPVSGVTVRAIGPRTGMYRQPTEGAPLRKSEAERIEDARRAAAWDAATTQETVTGADGTYRLTGLRAMEYYVRAWSAGLAIRAAPGQSAERVFWPGDEFHFQAARVLRVHVAIRDSAGNSPTRANVRWTTLGERGGGSGAFWTPTSATIYMEPGTWVVRATADGRDILEAGPVTVTVEEGSETPSIVLETRGVARIRGHIAMHAGQNWSSIRVYAAPNVEGRVATDAELAQGLETSARGPRVAFAFDNLEPGTYTVAASLDGRTIDCRTKVTVADRTVACTLIMPPLDGKRALLVRVTGPDGELLDDVQIGLEIREGSSVMTRGAGRAHRQPDGRWLYPIVDRAQQASSGRGARWTLVVTSDALGSKRVPFDHGREQSIDIAFGRPASVEITAQGASEDTRRRLAVVLVGKGESGATALRLMDRSNAQGLGADARKTISPVAPGKYDVQLWLRAALPNAILVAQEKITVGTGILRVNLRVPRIVNVTLRAPGLEPGDRLSLSPVRDPGSRSFQLRSVLDDSKSATWRNIPVGRYVVAGLIAGKHSEMLLNVTASDTHTFVPANLDGLRLTVDEPYGKLANAGFITGDVIIRIADTSFRTRGDWSMLLVAAHGKQAVDFVVLRSGSETVVTARPTLFTGEPVGGHWQPVTR